MGSYYNRAGEAINNLKWAELHENKAYVVVARAELPLNYVVSTVWLGIDHSFGVGPLKIFETMVFAPFSSSDVDSARYATEEEAKRGHNETYLRWFAMLLEGIEQLPESE